MRQHWIDIINRTSQQIQNSLKLKTRKLHYYVEKGGVFLKDAAVLAGFGCIGENSMLITPSHGPRIRLRALFLDAEIFPTAYAEPRDDAKMVDVKVLSIGGCQATPTTIDPAKSLKVRND